MNKLPATFRFPLCGLCWALLLFATGLESLAQDCVGWVQRTDIGTPGKRYGHAMAYDSHRGVTVFFGGAYSEIGGTEIFFQDTWEYDGVRWTSIETLGGPPTHRANHSMCYDAIRREVVLTGGRNEDGVVPDTWVYSRSANGPGIWSQRAHHPPPHVAYSAMAFDENRGVAVLTGGLPSDDNDWDDDYSVWEVWEWNGYQWSAGAHMPNDKSHHAMTYDSLRRTVCVQGGVELEDRPCGPFGCPFDPGAARDLMVFSTEWLSRPPPAALDNTLDRHEHAMVYDNHRDRLVLFGGVTQPTISHMHLEYNAAQDWRAMPITPVAGRAQPAMVYDSRRRVTVLFGGVAGARYDDTWELISLPPTIVISNSPEERRCEFTSYTLTASVSSSSASLQWEYNESPIPGANQHSHSFFLRTSDAGSYRLRATDTCGNVVYSRPVLLIVNTRARITEWDDSRRERCPGQSITFSVTATGTSPLYYQWYKDSVPILEATQDTLTLGALTPEHTGDYSVTVANECNTALSTEAHLQVGPTISLQPSSQVAQVCDSALFSVAADGVGTLQYQWRLNGMPLADGGSYSGVNTPALLILPILYPHEGNYDVVITDDCGPSAAVTSAAANLKILLGVEWVLRTTNGPSPRSGHAMAYDTNRAVTMLFGGWHTNQAGDYVTLNDLWEWNGTRWTMLMPHSFSNGFRSDGYTPTYTGRPVHRTQHTMVYDSARDRLVLFGGQSITPNGFNLILNDVWEWDGTQWLFRTTNGPARRLNASMAYDSDRRVSAMFGGFLNGPDPFAGAIWEWNGVQWNMILPVGGPERNYSQDIGAMAYDTVRRVMVFGRAVTGFGSSEFWTWDAVNWHRLSDVPQLYSVSHGDMAFDSYRQRTVWFGGEYGGAGVDHTLFFATNWQTFTTSPRKPSHRLAHAMAYDHARWATVMFGGQASSYRPERYNGETWELIAVDKPLINEQPTDQRRSTGETATFSLTAVGREQLTYQWFHNNVMLTDGGRISGATTPTLTISNLNSSDRGHYMARVRNPCGDSLSQSAELMLDGNLRIFIINNVVTVTWFAPGSVLQQADAPTGDWGDLPQATSPHQPSPLGPAKFYRLRLR